MLLSSPLKLKKEVPVSAKGKAFVLESRNTIQRIFEGLDSRLLFIVGPCSIHNVEEGLVYAKQLKTLAEEVKEHAFIVMRCYLEKPRTRQGWKGLAHDPYLNGSHDMETGIYFSRQFLRDLAELELPSATEFLTPHFAPYIEDLISWGCIGARTSASQVHRILASSLPIPIGFKNSIDGNTECAISGIHVARSPHTFIHTSDEGKLVRARSKGNPYSHLVLRGSRYGTNYDRKSVQEAISDLRREELPPRLLIDCSHGNSKGGYFKQREVFQEVLEQIREGNHLIMGMMLESNLEAGSQKIPAQLCDLQKGVSITDACLDFSTAAELISSSSMSMSLTHS